VGGMTVMQDWKRRKLRGSNITIFEHVEVAKRKFVGPDRGEIQQ